MLLVIMTIWPATERDQKIMTNKKTYFNNLNFQEAPLSLCNLTELPLDLTEHPANGRK